MYHCVSAYCYTPSIVDHAFASYSSWYSTLPLLLPPVTSSPLPTNYFRLRTGSSPTCQTPTAGLQILHDTEGQGQGQGQGHDWPLLLPSVTSASPPANYFRLTTESQACPTKTSRVLRDAEAQSQGRSQGHGNYWRPVCLDEGQTAIREFDANFRCSPPEKTAL